MKQHLPVFLVFTFLVLGCTSLETVESTKVAPSEIYQDYRIKSAKNSTFVTATFHVEAASGETIDLDAPSLIELNGAEMRESKPFFLKGTDYNYQSNKFETDFQFDFHAADGKTYRNETSVAPAEIISEKISLSRSRDVPVRLSRALAANESLSFSLRSADIRVESAGSNANANSVTAESYTADGGVHLDEARSSFTIDDSQLKKFALGKAFLIIEISKDSDLQQSTGKGGRIRTSYESQSVEVNVVN